MESDGIRRSLRSNKGIPPNRFGNYGWEIKSRMEREKFKPPPIDLDGYLNQDLSNLGINGGEALPPATLNRHNVRSIASSVVSSATHSVIQKEETELWMMTEINKLEEMEEQLKRRLANQELEIGILVTKIDQKKKEIEQAKNEERDAIQTELTSMELKASELMAEFNVFKIDASFYFRKLEREKSLIQQKAKVKKLHVEFDDDQQLGSDEEDFVDHQSQKQLEVYTAQQELKRAEEEERQVQRKKTSALANLHKLQQEAQVPISSTKFSPHSTQQYARAIPGSNPQSVPVHNPHLSMTERFINRQAHGRALPHFYGRPEEWTSFYTAFIETTKICGFSASENMERLRNCLKDKAKKVVECLLDNHLNLGEVIDVLQLHFGQPKQIIHTLIQKTKAVPAVKLENLSSLIEFGTAVRNMTATIMSLNSTIHLCNPQLLMDLEQKLPPSMQLQWKQWLRWNPHANEDILSFSDWLKENTRDAISLCPVSSNPKTENRTTNNQAKKKPWENNHFRFNPRKEDHALVAQDQEEKVPLKQNANIRNKEKFCPLCKTKGHKIQKCEEFAKLNYEDKVNVVRDLKLCFSCLNYGHIYKECRSKKTCSHEGCAKDHHPLLHKEVLTVAVQNPQPNDVVAYANLAMVYTMLQIVAVTLRGPKGQVETLALLDPGATVTLLDGALAKQLGLEGKSVPFMFGGPTDAVHVPDSKIVQLDIITKSKVCYHIQNVKTVDKLNLPTRTVSQIYLNQWKHLKGINFSVTQGGKPLILIGQDNADLIIPFRRIDGTRDAPIAAETKLGWTLNGNLPPTKELPRIESVLLTQHDHDWEYFHQLIKRYFSTEDFGVKLSAEKPRSKEDRRSEMIMEKTMKRVGDRFETGLLWKEDDVTLPESRSQALKRLINMEKKMNRDADFARKYFAKVDDYLEKGYIRKLTQEEIDNGGPRLWYLPHFAVSKPSKPDKIRLVHDAAAIANGRSLNDYLMKGPDQLTPLPSVLFKFRQKAIAIAGDIKEMYHQIMICEEDQNSQRFLYRGMDRDRSPDEYVISVMFFGAACSPCLAQEAKNRNAREGEEEFPEAAKAIVDNHYVDDYLDSLDTVEQTYQQFLDICELHRRGGFHICNWICSSPEVMERIPDDLRAPSVKSIEVDSEHAVIERVLGLHWVPSEDYFTFKIGFEKIPDDILRGERVPTKREALSLLMSVYDPLGFLAHFTVKAKILLQNAWRSGIGWDDELPISMQDKWNIWIEELKGIENFKLYRCYSLEFSTSNNIQLHIFVDGSEQAFCAISYFRIESGSGVEVSFVSAKTRVAPLKPISVPRMELQAAVMGCRIAQTIKDQHDIKPHRTVYWSDSSTVMAWIRADGRNFQQFVSHRIGEIQESSEVREWRWLPTKENVADEATRDNTPCDWSTTSRWVNGPVFMKLDEQFWPKEKLSKVPEESLELKKEFVCTVLPMEPICDPISFSSWTRLVRTTARIQKLFRQFKKEGNVNSLTPDDLNHARKYWFKLSQLETFFTDINCIKAGKDFDKSSRLLKLSPYLDKDGLLRAKGRINAASCIPVATRNPIILDPKHYVTRLLIRYYHESANHHGQERVTNEIRQQFHILNLRAAVRSSWTHCQVCQIARAEPAIPQMGQLPSSRLTRQTRPFIITGMDYFGPMEVTVGRHHEKRYGVLFTCMSTRAIHVEIAYSLTTDSCIMAIRRFAARRGLPSEIHSDNGTNLKGACKELQQALLELDQNQISSTLTNQNIKWSFIPPAAPHMGGSWERQVKSFKVALQSTLKDRFPKD